MERHGTVRLSVHELTDERIGRCGQLSRRACGSNAMPVKTSDFSPVLPAAIIEKTVADGSIYSGGINDGLFGDRKAYRVGDIITIILREKTLSEKSASNVTSRKANNSAVAGIGIGDTNLGLSLIHI